MASSEQANEKFNSPTNPLRAVFPCVRRGVSRTAGRRPGRRARKAQDPCRGLGVASDPPSDQPKALPRAGPQLTYAEDTHSAITEGWQGGGPGDLRTPTPDPTSLERGLRQPISTGGPRLWSCNDQVHKVFV
eukprot:6212031-Pleurochrysis_carterae.AAC.3